MSRPLQFPDLTGWERTRDTLHRYCQAVGVVPRTLLEPHPKWWHASLRVIPAGLTTQEIPLPGGGTLHLVVDMVEHTIKLETDAGTINRFDMTAGLTSTDLGAQILDAVAALGLSADYPREKYEDDAARVYDPVAAGNYLTALQSANAVFARHRDTLSPVVGPIQLWPHGFDLAFEWFGTRKVEYVEQDEVEQFSAQLNLGFSPGEASHPQPYFYSNPWPFEAETLLATALPDGARWFDDSWQGSILPYAELTGQPDAGDRLFAYAQAVYAIAAPTLMA